MGKLVDAALAVEHRKQLGFLVVVRQILLLRRLALLFVASPHDLVGRFVEESVVL